MLKKIEFNNIMTHKHLTQWLTVMLLLVATLGAYAQNDILKWEPDIRAFEQLDATRTYDPNAILFVGSSSIRLWKSIDADMQPYPVIQRGYGGAKFTDLLYYINRIITPNHRFRAMVVFVANDINGGNSDRKPKEVQKSFQKLVKEVRKHHKSEPIFFVEITPTPSRWKVWSQTKDANLRVAKFCNRKKGVEFIATSHRYLDNFKQPRKELFMADQLHFNAEGYAIWTELIKAELDKKLK